MPHAFSFNRHKMNINCLRCIFLAFFVFGGAKVLAQIPTAAPTTAQQQIEANALCVFQLGITNWPSTPTVAPSASPTPSKSASPTSFMPTAVKPASGLFYGWNCNSGTATSYPCGLGSVTWTGIECLGSSVSELVLTGKSLKGTISPSISALSDLAYLTLDSNSFGGQIPSELSNLSNLYSLSLSSNFLSKTIPSELSALTNLFYLYLDSNFLSKTIPSQLSASLNMRSVNFGSNLLTGTISLELSALTNLQQLDLSSNSLGGQIPSQLSALTNLKQLYLSSNKINGTIPLQLLALCNLENLYLDSNSFNETISPQLSALSNLKYLNLACNSFFGEIPTQLFALSNLITLNISRNSLRSTIPSQLSELSSLVTLDLSENSLKSTIPLQLFKLARLANLYLGSNHFTGTISPQFAALFNLQQMDLSSNSLSNKIPYQLFDPGRLENLNLACNFLTGTIPSQVSSLRNLNSLNLSSNAIVGFLPQQLFTLRDLNILDISSNSLNNTIPFQVSELNRLTNLQLNNNRFSGQIPAQIMLLTKLKYLYLNNNSLSGPAGTYLCISSIADGMGRLRVQSNQFSCTATCVATKAAQGNMTYYDTSTPQSPYCGSPTSQPSRQPSSLPSSTPSSQPFELPSGQPSKQPSGRPSLQPFNNPSSVPSCQPFRSPSGQPSQGPSHQPSGQPTSNPTYSNSKMPSGLPSVKVGEGFSNQYVNNAYTAYFSFTNVGYEYDMFLQVQVLNTQLNGKQKGGGTAYVTTQLLLDGGEIAANVPVYDYDDSVSCPLQTYNSSTTCSTTDYVSCTMNFKVDKSWINSETGGTIAIKSFTSSTGDGSQTKCKYNDTYPLYVKYTLVYNHGVPTPVPTQSATDGLIIKKSNDEPPIQIVVPSNSYPIIFGYSLICSAFGLVLVYVRRPDKTVTQHKFSSAAIDMLLLAAQQMSELILISVMVGVGIPAFKALAVTLLAARLSNCIPTVYIRYNLDKGSLVEEHMASNAKVYAFLKIFSLLSVPMLRYLPWKESEFTKISEGLPNVKVYTLIAWFSFTNSCFSTLFQVSFLVYANKQKTLSKALATVYASAIICVILLVVQFLEAVTINKRLKNFNLANQNKEEDKVNSLESQESVSNVLNDDGISMAVRNSFFSPASSSSLFSPSLSSSSSTFFNAALFAANNMPNVVTTDEKDLENFVTKIKDSLGYNKKSKIEMTPADVVFRAALDLNVSGDCEKIVGLSNKAKFIVDIINKQPGFYVSNAENMATLLSKIKNTFGYTNSKMTPAEAIFRAALELNVSDDCEKIVGLSNKATFIVDIINKPNDVKTEETIKVKASSSKNTETSNYAETDVISNPMNSASLYHDRQESSSTTIEEMKKLDELTREKKHASPADKYFSKHYSSLYESAWQILIKPDNAIDSGALSSKLTELGLSEYIQVGLLEDVEVRDLASLLKPVPRRGFLSAISTAKA